MHTFLTRIKEPSTWAGLSALALLFGLDQVKVDVIAQAAVAVAGAAAVFLPEGSK